ncbi:LamG-like jellyroll fold domain-containing protein [Streptomyces sp. NPDC056230]|uniref:LamG-like jellyroll fold domain-containing protein n=1 Tax=Streptomyces sp. NPDC056230 TaxID=3345754 RepID=UPI0035DA0021
MDEIPNATVEVAFDGGPFSGSYTWTDVSPWVKGFKVSRGRSYELDRIEAGTLSFTLDNADGRFTAGKRQFGSNSFANFAAPVKFSLDGRANNTSVQSLALASIDQDGQPRVVSRRVVTNGLPVACYFAINWFNAAGTSIRFVIGTRFLADSVAAVYTHEETPPAGAVRATAYLYAESYPQGNAGLTVTLSDATWHQTAPYYPNVLPRRRVRVRTANLLPADVAAGGDVSQSSGSFSVAHSAGSSAAWSTSPKSGTGSVRVDYGNAGAGDFANSVYCGWASSGKATGLTRVQGGATYSTASQLRLGALSKDVAVKTRIRWYDSSGAFISASSGGPSTVMAGDRYNLVFNPGVDVSLTNAVGYGQAVYTRARITTDGAPVGSAVTACVAHTNTADNTTSSSGTTWDCEPVTGAGTRVTTSAWVKLPATGVSRLFLVFRQGTTTVKSAEILPLPPTGSWQKVTATLTLTSGQTVDRVGVSCYAVTGTTWLADACHAVIGADTGVYADGSFPGYHWSGTAFASPTVADSWSPQWRRVEALSQVAPPTAAWASVEVGTSNSAAASSVFIDELQLEQGSALSGWQPGGSIFHGYIEKWPTHVEQMTSTVEVSAVDGFSVLADAELHAPYQQAVLSSVPLGYWPLGDAVGTTSIANLARDNQPASLAASKYGAATALFGAPSIVARDDTTCFSLANVSATQGTVIDICDGGRRRYPIDAELSVAFWVQPILPSNGSVSTLFHSFGDTNGRVMQITMDSTGAMFIDTIFANGVTNYLATSPILSAAKPSFIAATVSNGVTRLYVNGAFVADSLPWGTPSMTDIRDIRRATFAGKSSLWGVGNGEYANGRYAHLAVWDRALPQSTIRDLWGLADNGGPAYTESEAARLSRIATFANFDGEVAADPGVSTLLTPDWESGASALEEVQKAAADASGYVFMDGDGRLTYHGRRRRQSAPVRFVLSDSGGMPYEPGLQFEMDQDRIINEVTYSRPGGSAATVSDAASRAAYGRKSKSIDLRVTSDTEAAGAAYGLLNAYAAPSVRCDQVTLNPTATAALFPVTLGIEIGDRITLADLPSSAPASSFDFYVEAIETSVEGNGTAPEWTTVLSLSPAAASDVWVLEDPALGRLDGPVGLAY